MQQEKKQRRNHKVQSEERQSLPLQSRLLMMQQRAERKKKTEYPGKHPLPISPVYICVELWWYYERVSMLALESQVQGKSHFLGMENVFYTGGIRRPFERLP